jgi:hypothetical protein
MRRSWLAIATLTLVLTTVSACGPFDGTSSSASGTASTPNAGVTPDASGKPAATPIGGATAGGSDGEAYFCALAKEKGAQNLQVFDAQSSTPEQQRQVLLNIDALTSAAPEEIHADFVRFDEFEHKLFDAGGQADGELAQEAGGQDLRDSLTRIGAYLDQHCGIHG